MMDRMVSVAAILDSLPDPALALDNGLCLVHGNALARDILGTLRPGEHIALSTRNPELLAAVESTRLTGRREVFDLVLRNPVERRLEGAAVRLGEARADRSAPAVLVILQDFSERDALSRMRMEFVANASHELRTPLTALSGFIETLRGPARDDSAARDRFLAIMAEQAARMTRLIDDLLLLSRVEMRAHLTPAAVADLDLVAANVIEHLAGQAAKERTSLVLEPSPGQALLRGDHDELVQAVHNLVQNAVKYGRPGGRVVVRVGTGRTDRSGGRQVRISVIDDGPGISPEHVPRLTERFYRVSTAASREKGGTGLGLAIVKHIVTRHHGIVDISSVVGQGSTFTLAFPAIEPQGR